MSANSKIEWTDHTFNPWIGCQAISPGCINCYAADWAKRYGRDFAERTRTKTWAAPLKWNAEHETFFAQHGRRQRVFCASLADVFDNQVPIEWRMDLFKLIADTPNLDWLVLTKRIGNVMSMCSGDSLMFDVICERVWLGATVVNQEEADRDIPKLLAVPAAKRFLSMEPLLGPVDIGRSLWSCCGDYQVGAEYMGQQEQVCCGSPEVRDRLDWVIVGGESSRGARPMHPDWARSLRDQCAAADVPFLFKQWGEWLPAKEGRSITGKTLVLEGAASFTSNPQWHSFEDGQQVARVGKKAAGRLLDSIENNGFPS